MLYLSCDMLTVAKDILVFADGVTNIVGGLIAYGITFYEGDAVEHWRIVSRLLVTPPNKCVLIMLSLIRSTSFSEEWLSPSESS